jgi:hypothetical protein
MTDDRGAREIGPVTYNVNKILDTHTHLTGQESAEEIPECKVLTKRRSRLDWASRFSSHFPRISLVSGSKVPAFMILPEYLSLGETFANPHSQKTTAF